MLPNENEVTLLDFKPYEAEDPTGQLSYGAHLYIGEDDGILNMNDIRKQAELLKLDFDKAKLMVKGDWLIIDLPDRGTDTPPTLEELCKRLNNFELEKTDYGFCANAYPEAGEFIGTQDYKTPAEALIKLEELVSNQ